MRTRRDEAELFWLIARPIVLGLALALGALWIFSSFGCAAALPSPPIPTRPADRPWHVGVTFGPWQDEWDRVGALGFIWRIEQPDVASVAAHGQPMLLLAVCEDDASVEAFRPYLSGNVFGIELGNEPNFAQDAASVNAWYLREIATLRSWGYTGLIATAGIGNIDDGTLAWLQQSIQGLPPSTGVSFHAYSSWRGQLGKLDAIVGAHPLLMTEWGEPPPNGDEQAQASIAASDIALIKAAGAQLLIRYQMHDGSPGTSGWNYGIHANTTDNHWRPITDVLAAQAQ